MPTGKKILITGGAGYVGSTLIPMLLDKGYLVRVADFLMFGGEGLIGNVGHPNFELMKGDLRDKRFLDQVIKDTDSVIHLAALVGEEACQYNPVVTEQINYGITNALAHAALKNGLEKFIFASTCSNYGAVENNIEVDEEAPLDLTTLYTITKKKAEDLLLSDKFTPIHPCILRFAMVFGLSPKFRFNLIINDLAREAVLDKKITIYSPSSWRAFTHIRDAAHIYLSCLEAPKELIGGQIYNASSENMQKQQLMELVKKHMPEVEIEVIETKKDPRSYRVSTKKIRRDLGFKPHKSVEEGFVEVKEAIEKGMFTNPRDKKYDSWYEEKALS